MKETYYLHPNIWFVVEVTNGEITSVEEHDYRAGGWVKPVPGQTQEELFFACVNGRISGNDDAGRQSIIEEAKQFLDQLKATNTMEKVNV